METRNVTLSLPKDVLYRIKVIATQRETSVSKLLTQALLHIVQQEDRYIQAQQRQLQRFAHPFDLGTHGTLKTKRDELHERR